LSRIESLYVGVVPLTVDHTVNDASELFLREDHARFLSLPVVDAGHSMEDASRYVTEHISFPITEDFVVTAGGVYLGVSIV
jgi:hypothetical protein